MKLVTIALRDFALPAPRTGSIEAHSGYGRATIEGQEIHARVQRRRAKSDPAYQPEVLISCSFEREGYLFSIEGRMDGFFQHKLPKIEEIKTSFNIAELADRLARNPMDHPYCLQLQTYGYFYWSEHKIVPKLTFHLVSSRNGESKDIAQSLELPVYEKWMERRFLELVGEIRKAEKRVGRRKNIAASFAFPFGTPRPGQAELMDTIEQGMNEHSRMLIQAPTGLGKTAGVLYPVLREALSRGQTVVYVTPKNSQHLIAEDVVRRFQETGAKVKSLAITAKSKICFKNEPLCSPAYCEYSLDYYAKIHERGILDILARKRKLDARIFRTLGEAYEVCPFELQFDGIQEADTVICDYNYVFAPKSALRRITKVNIDQSGKPNLVIDEFHNLPSRAMEYYSPSLSSITLESMRNEIREVNPLFRIEAEELLDDCIQAIIACRPIACSAPVKIDPPAKSFLETDSKLRAFLSCYLDSDVEIQPHDVILRLSFYWSEFTEALEYARDPGLHEFFTTFHPHSTGGIIKITCCDASAMLKECYDEYEQTVGFSATLKPFEYYAKLSGLDSKNMKIAEFPSPFPRDLRKLLIIPQISTRYSDRERNYFRIADTIHKIAALRLGNYFAFFPSFEFLERVYSVLQPPQGFSVLKQERDMKAARVTAILAHLHEQAAATIVFAVQGGTFSEGVDYPGEMVIGAFVVGPPLPNYDLEREQMRAYYQERYGAGFDYAYTIPAMARAIQAAGRVIRSGTDRGLIVLMDSRFVQPAYARAMPVDWFQSEVVELVSDSILKDVSEFWERDPVQKDSTCLRSCNHL
jgi:DNA excision repair protein ERCC-2